MSETVFETADLHWELTRPREFAYRHRTRIPQLRYSYYRGLSQMTQHAAYSLVKNTGGKNWVHPNRLVGKTSYPGQRWAHHRILSAYDEKNTLVGWADIANNASSNRPFPFKLVGPAERFAKLHVPADPLLGSRFGCVREVIGGEEREGFILMAASVGIRECTVENQALSAYPLDRERKLKLALTALGMHRNEARPVKDIELDVGIAAQQEPWVLERAWGARDALGELPGALAVMDQVEVARSRWV